MEHYRLRKYRSPEVWARVRAAYEQGQIGRDVAERFDVGLANLRKKASREGWTRTATATRLEQERAAREGEAPPDPPVAPPPLSPREAMTQAVQEAATLLSRNRAAEAMALLKGAEQLSRLLEITPGLHEMREEDEEATRAVIRKVERMVDERARQLVASGWRPEDDAAAGGVGTAGGYHGDW